MSRTAAKATRPEKRSPRHLERRTKVMKALAHASRLAMVEALTDGEKCVCDLQEIVGADMSTVSKHLSLLKDAGILLSEKRGLQVWYRLRVPCLLDFFTCVDAVFANPDADRVEVAPPAGSRTAGACAGSCSTAARRA
jgi:DNA-binding transcriptional ArsR family regulator